MEIKISKQAELEFHFSLLKAYHVSWSLMRRMSLPFSTLRLPVDHFCFKDGFSWSRPQPGLVQPCPGSPGWTESTCPQPAAGWVMFGLTRVCSVFAPAAALQALAVSESLRPHGPQHARPPRPSPAPGVHPDPCPSSRWCHPAVSSSVVPFSSCPQSFPPLGSSPVSQLFASGGQSMGASASNSVLSVNVQGWFLLGLTGLISLLSKGHSRIFCSTTVHGKTFKTQSSWLVLYFLSPTLYNGKFNLQ